eukprot:1151332-Pelagomonas_calceolata.AAC.2
MAKSSEHVTDPFMASAYQIRQFMCEHALRDRLHHSSWEKNWSQLACYQASAPHESLKGHIRCKVCNHKLGCDMAMLRNMAMAMYAVHQIFCNKAERHVNVAGRMIIKALSKSPFKVGSRLG